MSSFDALFEDIYRVLAEVQRQMAGSIARGTVHSVDAETGTVRLKLADGTDGEPFLSPAVPYAQFMGALKVHTPPSVGQQMTVLSAAGDFRQGLAVPMTQSDENKSPSTKGDENVATYGGFKITLDSGKLQVTEGALSVTIGAGKVAIKGDVEVDGNVSIKGDFAARDGSFKHNDHDVGSDHKHTGVTPGDSLTGTPP